MRRSTGMALVATELGLLSWWSLNVRFETGFDTLQYHRMASSIVRNGLAPWVVSPLSYVGLYPGSDSSGVPFLAGSFAIVSGLPMQATALIYDAVLLLLFGLGLFALTRQLTDRTGIALVSVLMGTLAFGFFTTLLWSLDERSFNVALAPLFLLLSIPLDIRTTLRDSSGRLVSLGIVSTIMLLSHLNFLLLVPFLVLIPLVYRVTHTHLFTRYGRKSSIAFFATVAVFPLLLFGILNQLGILSDLGLDYQLESSALFSGKSPLIFLANAAIFLGTRIGPLNAFLMLLGLAHLAHRPYLYPRSILLGGFLVAGFLGLPIVLYSKDLLTPLSVLVGAVGLAGTLRSSTRRQFFVLTTVAVVVVSGSIVFDDWNAARTSRAGAELYWALPGVTPEATSGSVWINMQSAGAGCIYGNNFALLQQVAAGDNVLTCHGLAVDYLIGLGSSAVDGSVAVQAVYAGISGANPSNWLASPELDKMSSDFAQVPGLSFDSGRSLLLKYNVSMIVVDLQKPSYVPSYGYQEAYLSPFFVGLWASQYPLYQTESFAVFRIK